jgi:osmotically inducible lipoprotein OsmB
MNTAKRFGLGSRERARKYAAALAAILLASGLSACGGMSTREQGTVVGAGVGTAAGAAIGGNVGSAVAGGVVGGVVGNQVTK